MSQQEPTDATDKKEEFRELIRETFEPHTTSKQYRYDHPDGDLPKEVDGETPPVQDPHNDGGSIYQRWGLSPLPKFLTRAARQEHSVAKHPRALAHFLTHIPEWEKWRLSEGRTDFEDISRPRQNLFEWYLGKDKDDEEEQEKARKNRMKRLTPGGTGIILHGEQGTTKTTAMYWLITNLIEVNQQENVIWQSTLDDTEWTVFGPWATLCLPSGVDVEMKANPYPKEYERVGAFEIEPEDVVRQVIRYDDPRDLVSIMADRTPGQIYVVYPDPRFRSCQALTGWSYESVWEADSSDEATDLNHFWFALMEAVVHSNIYNDWTTLVADEAHKWLRMGKGNDEHDWWNKIDDWATYWGDARKHRLSCILAIHKWHEIHSKVRDKVRWGGTMNGEEFPTSAPLSGKNKNQDLGDMVVWNNDSWNHVGYPDIKRMISIPGEIGVSYPGYEAVKDAKS